ncbi:MAG: calcineurin-like phosphoesterase C-terminal domain-containing protein [Verrucomicrobiae bacterium]|nr:calcineurin-like phosphoesterase C-terminal domain-containing protein [Verrucomicrobiae bacterium]
MKKFFCLGLIVTTLSELLFAANGGAGMCDEWSQSADEVTGFVYEDRNHNSRQDDSEPGVVGVSVSNGCEVVLTDAQGFYSIGLAPTQILFISQPSGYEVPVDKNNLPQFYYLHYPTGSPKVVGGEPVEWLFPVIEPTGPLPDHIDFPLHRLRETETRFKAHGFADTQAKSDLDQDMLREDLVNTLLGNPYGARFTLTMGDVVNDNLTMFDRHKKMMGLIGIPNWNLPGNHDVNYESPNAHFATETYKKHYGPIYYSFNYGNVHVVALNNVEYAGAAARKGGSGRPYRGYISDDQIRWLEQDLTQVAKDKLIVIATHIPLVAEADDGNTRITGPGTENFDKLLELLKPFEHIYGLAGHDTSNSWKVKVGHTHGWHGQPWIAHTLAEARGSGWTRGPRDLRGVSDAMMADGNPNGFYLFKFDDVSMVPEFIPFPFGSDAAQGMRIVLEPEIEPISDQSLHRGRLQSNTKVVVNLFDGGVRDRVHLSLDGGQVHPMKYVVRTDPFVEKTFARYADTGEAYPASEPSSHIWEYELPAKISTGIHHLVVSSEDEFGQKQRGVFTFEIVE